MLKSNRNGPSVSTGIKEKSTLWDLVIRPKRHLLDINLKEIWNYRDLVMLFVRRDFVANTNRLSWDHSGLFSIR